MSKKIDIPEEKLKKLYMIDDKTTYEIADIYHCDKRVISRFLKKYKIEIKRYNRKFSFYYNQILNPEQKELLRGSLLGDGCITRHSHGINGCRYTESHSISQLDYLLWKKEKLSNFIFRDIKFVDNSKNNSYGNGMSCVLLTVSHKDFVSLYEEFYKDGKKRVPDNLKLSPLSLSVWFFDDGSVSKNGRNSFFATFHTEGLDENSILILRKCLKDNFDIDTFIVNVKHKYKIIRLNNQNYKKLCNILNQYPIPCMQYKIKFSDNPVETCSDMNRVLEVKNSNANTLSSS